MTRTYPTQPNLRCRNTGTQAIGRDQFICMNLILSCLDVDCHELSLVTLFDNRTNVTLKHIIATMCKLLFTIP
jgi:hypothetical protein